MDILHHIRRVAVSCVLTGICIAAATVVPGAEAIATTHGFVEDLSSRQYRDPGTTADWDTTRGVIDLRGFTVSDVNAIATAYSAYHLAIAGNVVYVSDHVGGFTSIDVTDPYSPELLDTYMTADAAMGSAVAGNLAYVACWNAGLVILNVTDPDYILYKGGCDTPGYARAVAVAGDYAFVADMGSGLQVIDVSDPSTPAIVGSYDTAGDAWDIEVAGNHAFIADNGGGLAIVDISDPTAPSLAASYPLSTARGIDIAGNVAYVANYFSGLYVIDIADPASPSLMDTYNSPGTCYDVHVAGDVAYLADGASGGVRVVDVGDPYAISLVYVTYTATGPLDVRRAGEFLYVADANGGLAIKRLVSAMPPDETGGAYTAHFLTRPKVAGDYLYAPCYSNGLRVIDIGDPFGLVEAGWYMGSSIYDVAVRGDTIFAAGYDQGFVILDVSDPVSPTYVNAYSFGDYAWGVDVSGDLACVAGGGVGLLTIDVSDPSVPVELDRIYAGSVAEKVLIDGDVAFVCSGFNGLRVFDISDPTNLSEIGSYDPAEYIYDVTVDGDRAYVSCALEGIRVLNIANPASPALVGSAPDYSCRQIAIGGDQLFAAGLDDGIVVYDLSDPDSPRFETRYVPATGSPNGIALEGDFVFAAGFEYGVRALRVYDFYYEGLDNRAVSTAYPSTGLDMKKVRLAATAFGNIDWEFSVDGGAGWQPIVANDAVWKDVTAPGGGGAPAWRAELRLDAATPDEGPECSLVHLEWLHEPAVIDSVVDVPGDQGGYVRVYFSRSSYDFVDEMVTPVVAYDIYRRVDDPLLAAQVAGARSPSLRTSAARAVSAVERPAAGDAGPAPAVPGAVFVDGRLFVTAEGVPGFPPGVWENVASLHALQTDEYLALVPTEADSASATPWEAFVVTTHTTAPATWFVSPADSGYSVDNIAPAAPLGFAVAYNTGSGNALSWDESPETDLACYRVYRGNDPGFVPGPATLVHQTATAGWADPEYDGWHVHYRITAVDGAGNESPVAAPVTVTGGDAPGLPRAVALRQNIPNPFNPSTTIRFELPARMRARLVVYDVSGKQVRTLVDGVLPAGLREVAWNGRGDDGRPVASGIYFCRLSAGEAALTRKMALLR